MTERAQQAALAPSPEDAVRIRARPPNPRRLSRRVLLGGAGITGSIIAFALISGLSTSGAARAGADPAPVAATGAFVPEGLAQLPQTYQAANMTGDPEPPHDILWGTHGPPEGWENPYDDVSPPTDEDWNASDYETGPGPASAVPAAAEPAPIFFEARRTALPAAPETGAARALPREGGGRRDAFLVRQASAGGAGAYLPPASDHVLLAGAVIPAALVTALDSDLPGRVIAQVTAPVYDSVTGDAVLIPQGARLIGTYDSASTYGDGRLFLVWNRIVMPNGWSLTLNAMEATDPAGAAGLKDRTDHHTGQLASAIALSAALSVLANEAEEDGEADIYRSLGDAAAQEAARTGSRAVDRALNIRPTFRIRAGAPVRVLVTEDLVLEPYPS